MSDLKPETLEVPDRVRRQIEDLTSRLEAAESALTEALDAMEKVGRKYAGRSGLTAESERVFDELLATAARIRSQIEGSNDG